MINLWPPALSTLGVILLGIAGCAGSDDPPDQRPSPQRPHFDRLDAQEVARNLAEYVRRLDGGRLTVSCKPRPTEFENSTPWECKGTWSKGGYTDSVRYVAVVGEKGKILNFVTDP
jgi:hypothetical protein